MIITVTPNPAVDWTARVESFDLAGVNRVTSRTREASGKGVNVSIALHRAGIPTAAVFPAGGSTGQFLVDELRGLGVPSFPARSDVEVRTNITLMLPGSSGTKFNEPSAPLDAEAYRAMEESCEWALAKLADEERDRSFLAVCGSLPPGAPEDLYSRYVGLGHRLGVRVAVDASADALSRALEARPDLVKPNVHELAAEVGHPLLTVGDVASAAQALLAKGAGTVLASLGADGMLLADGDGTLFGSARGIEVVNTVGAGDASLAGYLAGWAQGLGRTGRLRSALEYASSAVMHETTLFSLAPGIAQAVTVRADFEPSQPLSEPARARAGI